MFIVFGSDISLVLQTREISLLKNNSHDLHRVITHSLVLVILQEIGHHHMSQWIGEGGGSVGGYHRRLVIMTFHSGEGWGSAVDYHWIFTHP